MVIINAMMAVANALFAWPLLVMALLIAAYYTVVTRGFQFNMFGHALKNTFGKMFEKTGEGDVSPFQATCAALSATIGVGNIAGVATAIATGGPGAIFWMWVIALLGLIVKFVEATTSVAYREKDPTDNMWHGGFYWTCKNALGGFWKYWGLIWAVVLGVGMIAAPAVQIGSLTEAVRSGFDVPPIIIGIIAAALAALVLLGGIKRIANFADKVVPFMAVLYVLGGLFVLIKFAGNIPSAFAYIFKGAFTGTAAVGGFSGAVMSAAVKNGVARAVYSGDVGVGTAGLVHASSTVNHPVKQGMWGMVEVFVDTIVVCTFTALVIMVTGAWETGATGAALTSKAFGIAFGNDTAGSIFVSVIIVFFAFTTIVVNSYHGQCCLFALKLGKIKNIYLVLACISCIVGSVGKMSVIWNTFDFFFAVCMFMCLIALAFLGKPMAAMVNDYRERVKTDEWEATSEDTVAKIPEVYANLKK